MSTEQKYRIEKLKQAIRDVVGYEPVYSAEPKLPPDVEESFLNRVLLYEVRSKQPLAERMSEAGITLVNPDELDDDSLSRCLWTVINGLVSIHIVPSNTDHLSDRELYIHLWNLKNSGEPSVTPHYFSRGWYIDCLGKDEEGNRLYMKFYASEAERKEFRRNFPGFFLPPHCEPPSDRDRLIPDL